MKSKFISGWLIPAAYLYIFLPVIIFVLLWLKWFIGIPLTILGLFDIYKTLIKEEPLWTPERNRELIIKLGIVLSIIVLWVLSSGIGGSVAQYPDHLYRNAIFKTLVDEPWPVRDVVASGTERGLTYYIGFWLPAALIGKISSYSFGLLFMQLWSIFGLFLIWRFICENQRDYKIWFLVVFIAFGGLDAIGRWLTGALYEQAGNSYEWWAIFYNYPGNNTHLYWAYNQAIYGWLIYLLIKRQRNNKGLLLIWSASLISCTFPAVGLIPFVVFRAMENSQEEKPFSKLWDGIKSSISIPNLIGLLLALVFVVYLLPNDTVVVNMQSAPTEEASGVVISVVDDQTVISGLENIADGFQAYPWTTKLWMYLWFILLEVGGYFLLVYPAAKKKPIYWLSLIVLLIAPCIKVGYYLDFCERASIPAMLCLYELVITAMREYKETRKYALLTGLIVVLSLGSVTAFDTVRGTMTPTAEVVENLIDEGVDVVPQKVSNKAILSDGTFSCTSDHFFYKYLAKKGTD